MKFLYADWLLVCDDEFTIIPNGAIVFNKQIQHTGTLEELQKLYPNETFVYQGENSCLMPGLINTHVHLEFCSNKTTLKYGNFVQWLFSVIQNREELVEKASEHLIDQELQKMLSNGTTTIGAISSYGFDLNSCLKTPINVVYFSEVLGSKPEMIDTLFADFKNRLNTAIQNRSSNFIPAIAIHAAYSTHPILIREVLNLARVYNLAVTAHFQESKAENDWLNYSKGEFESFFKDMLDQHKSLQSSSEFLSQFKNLKNLSFTHCVEANEKELKQIHDLGATVIHCPNSNRLLNNTILNISNLGKIPMAIGTDGLSSNHTLNMFEELRNSFYMHVNFSPQQLATKLLKAATNNGAKALGLQKGQLTQNYDSDIISFQLPDSIKDSSDLAIAVILHTTKINKTYIRGTNELH
ncbi:MAG: metal-dependent hydrolase [Campylobacterales bacterium]|nr:metal-dependent hydrolase [Campylobacterales bacterium]